jgi:hypothetical protein
MNPNKLQQHIASLPDRHESYPVIEIPKWFTAQFPKPKRRRWWHWLRALLPLALLVSASAETIVVDLFGNVLGRFSWPQDRNVVVVVPTTGSVVPLPRPSTPAPTPCPR